MLNIVYLLLSIGMLRLAVNLWRLKLDLGLLKTAAFSIGLAAFGCVVSIPWVIPHLGPALVTMGHNISLYVSLPMLVLTAFDWQLGWRWQKATWGRVFLGLAALFELLRRAENSIGAMLTNALGFETSYALLLATLVMVCIGVYLYFAASLMALDSPDSSPK